MARYFQADLEVNSIDFNRIYYLYGFKFTDVFVLKSIGLVPDYEDDEKLHFILYRCKLDVLL